MVLLTTTPQILEVLSSLPPSALSTLSPITSEPQPIDSTAPDTDQPPSPSLNLPTSLTSPISHKTLIALSRLRHTDKNASSIPSLNTLLRGTRPYVAPPPPKPAPSPEYIALMTRLRQEQENKEYAALLPRRRRSSIPFDTPADEDQRANDGEDNISTSLVLNITLSVVMCAVAMFQMTRWFASDGVRVLMSLLAGLVVGIAEVGVYSIYLMKVRRAKEKERRKKERKTFIAEYLPGAEGVDATGRGWDGKDVAVPGVVEVGEKEEIWGRGVNGGMRRRVREKWEKEQEGNGENEVKKEK